MLRIEGLSKSFSDFALQNISFSIPQGCIMGLIGPNGSGKTTTIRLILNLLKTGGNDQCFGTGSYKRGTVIERENRRGL